jgi:hypothetical protein
MALISTCTLQQKMKSKDIKKPADRKIYRFNTHMEKIAVGGGIEPPRSS